MTYSREHWTANDYGMPGVPLHLFSAWLAVRDRALRNEWYAGPQDQPIVQSGTGPFGVAQAVGWANVYFTELTTRDTFRRRIGL